MYRDLNHQRLRADIVAAARELTVAGGWAGVTMAAVAGRVGVSRQTVYNEFGGRPALAEALAAAEIDTFVTAVRDRLAEHGPDARAAARAAVRHTLAEAADNPLIKAMLTNTDELLPFLTTRSDVALHAAVAVIREWAATHRPDIGAAVLDRAAESVVRLTVSHIVMPSAPADATAATLAEVFVRLLD